MGTLSKIKTSPKFTKSRFLHDKIIFDLFDTQLKVDLVNCWFSEIADTYKKKTNGSTDSSITT